MLIQAWKSTWAINTGVQIIDPYLDLPLHGDAEKHNEVHHKNWPKNWNVESLKECTRHCNKDAFSGRVPWKESEPLKPLHWTAINYYNRLNSDVRGPNLQPPPPPRFVGTQVGKLQLILTSKPPLANSVGKSLPSAQMGPGSTPDISS